MEPLCSKSSIKFTIGIEMEEGKIVGEVYEVAIGTTDPGSLIKYWQLLGYRVGAKDELLETNALQLYGVKSKLQSIRLRH
ncbi:unnamed protein product [Rotaria sp. Silwood2]|nr:unnamed protein product [Rotaria sp. Silwood2]